MVDFTRLSIKSTTHETDVHGQHVLRVNDPHALVQAAGYLKHRCAINGETVFFRGQTTTYKTLSPSLFRGIQATQGAQARLSASKNQFVAKVAKHSPIFSRFDPVGHEALLQHYGLATTWMDLVDNIWVALWFACHKAHAPTKSPSYLHFERRDPFTEVTGSAYILLIAADSAPTPFPGYSKGPNTESIDLRVNAPSVFLRPHAQHGILFRVRGTGVKRPIDYSAQVRGVIAIDLRKALAWLGDAPTLSVHSLFPPPFYDQGYKILLDGGHGVDPRIGGITLVGA